MSKTIVVVKRRKNKREKSFEKNQERERNRD